MKLFIYTRHKFRGENGELRSYDDTTPMGESSYESVKAMQKELIRRFPNRANRRNRKIKNGIVRIEGDCREHMTQVITLTA